MRAAAARRTAALWPAVGGAIDVVWFRFGGGTLATLPDHFFTVNGIAYAVFSHAIFRIPPPVAGLGAMEIVNWSTCFSGAASFCRSIRANSFSFSLASL